MAPPPPPPPPRPRIERVEAAARNGAAGRSGETGERRMVDPSAAVGAVHHHVGKKTSNTNNHNHTAIAASATTTMSTNSCSIMGGGGGGTNMLSHNSSIVSSSSYAALANDPPPRAPALGGRGALFHHGTADGNSASTARTSAPPRGGGGGGRSGRGTTTDRRMIAAQPRSGGRGDYHTTNLLETGRSNSNSNNSQFQDRRSSMEFSSTGRCGAGFEDSAVTTTTTTPIREDDHFGSSGTTGGRGGGRPFVRGGGRGDGRVGEGRGGGRGGSRGRWEASSRGGRSFGGRGRENHMGRGGRGDGRSDWSSSQDDSSSFQRLEELGGRGAGRGRGGGDFRGGGRFEGRGRGFRGGGRRGSRGGRECGGRGAFHQSSFENAMDDEDLMKRKLREQSPSPKLQQVLKRARGSFGSEGEILSDAEITPPPPPPPTPDRHPSRESSHVDKEIHQRQFDSFAPPRPTTPVLEFQKGDFKMRGDRISNQGSHLNRDGDIPRNFSTDCLQKGTDPHENSQGGRRSSSTVFRDNCGPPPSRHGVSSPNYQQRQQQRVSSDVPLHCQANLRESSVQEISADSIPPRETGIIAENVQYKDNGPKAIDIRHFAQQQEGRPLSPPDSLHRRASGSMSANENMVSMDRPFSHQTQQPLPCPENVTQHTSWNDFAAGTPGISSNFGGPGHGDCSPSSFTERQILNTDQNIGDDRAGPPRPPDFHADSSDNNFGGRGWSRGHGDDSGNFRGGRFGRGEFGRRVEFGRRGENGRGRGDFGRGRGDAGRGDRGFLALNIVLPPYAKRGPSPTGHGQSPWRHNQHREPSLIDGPQLPRQQEQRPSFKSFAQAPPPRSPREQAGEAAPNRNLTRPISPTRREPVFDPKPPPPPPRVFESIPSDAQKPAVVASFVTETRPAPTSPPCPPPQPSEPSALVLALTRLADLEAQMEYEFAKHTRLALEQKKLRAEYDVLEKLPVGMDSFKDDYGKLMASLTDDIEKQ